MQKVYSATCSWTDDSSSGFIFIPRSMMALQFWQNLDLDCIKKWMLIASSLSNNNINSSRSFQTNNKQLNTQIVWKKIHSLTIFICATVLNDSPPYYFYLQVSTINMLSNRHFISQQDYELAHKNHTSLQHSLCSSTYLCTFVHNYVLPN